MIAVRWALPFFSREFYLTTWIMVAVLLSAVALHLLGSINVVGIELIAFALGGAWFLMFVKNVELLVEQTDGAGEPANGPA
jgi:membrane associated rhomboid family serine protease